MSRNVEIYDLGSVQSTIAVERLPRRARVAERDPDRWRSTWQRMATTGIGGGVVRSMSLFVPGATQLIRGRVSRGLFFLTSLLFVALFCRAVIGTLERLGPTLELLGSSPLVAFWSLAVAFCCAAAIHLAAVGTSHERDFDLPELHPVVPGLASAAVPGWGQLLNGNRVRSLLFIGGSWLAAGVWIASSEAAAGLLDGYTPTVTPLEMALRNPATLWIFKWTVPVVIWTLGVYDATMSAHARRSKLAGGSGTSSDPAARSTPN